MGININMTEDAMWNELKELIKSFVSGRIKSIYPNDHIIIGEPPLSDVQFTYFRSELFTEDTKLDNFVDNIILSLRY